MFVKNNFKNLIKMKFTNMKTIVSLLFLFGIFTPVVKGQDYTASYGNPSNKILVGVKGGVNFSNQNFNYTSSDESFDLGTASLTSYHFGMFAEIPLSNKFRIQPELLYSKEGASINLFITEFKQTFGFLKIPVLLEYQLLDRLSFQAGPQLGIVLTEKLDVPIEDIEIAEGAYKNVEASIAIGTEFDISKRILLGARYNFGITDLSDTEDSGLKTSNFQLYLGVRVF